MGEERGLFFSQGLQPFILVAFVQVCAALAWNDSCPGTNRNEDTELAPHAANVLGVFFEEASGQL